MIKDKIFLFGDHADHLEKEILSFGGIKGGNSVRFADGEAGVEVNIKLPKDEIFIFQSIVNDQALMALLILVDTAKRSGIKNITAIVSYYGYARQDREAGEYSPVSAKLLAQMLETAGLDRLIVFDLHNEVIKSFFNIHITNLLPTTIFAQDISTKYVNLDDVVIVAPDVGALKRAKNLAETFNKTDVVIINKHRPKPGVSEVMNIIGEVENKICIITDDIVDSAGTLCNAADALKNSGAQSVNAYITHGVFAGKAAGKINNIAINRIEASALDEVVITNSTNLSNNDINCAKVRIISAVELLLDGMSQ